MNDHCRKRNTIGHVVHQPAFDLGGPDVEAAIQANAKLQAAILAEGSTLIRGLVQDHKIKVLAGYYDVRSEKVAMIGLGPSPFSDTSVRC